MKARARRGAGIGERELDGMAAVLAAGGELGRLISEHDWAATPLGPIESWKQSLRSAVGICLASRFPIVMYWGAELTVIYNDAYSEILGAKHPWALGKPCRVCWAEIWDTIGPMLGEVMGTGIATWSDDLELHLERHGGPEECYFSFSFSPVRVEDGSVGGVFTAVVETTGRVLSDRRLRVLTQLGEHAVGAHDADEAARRCAAAIEGSRPIPFALIYLCNETGTARLVARSGFEEAPPGGDGLDLQADDPWHFSDVMRTGSAVTVPLGAEGLKSAGDWAHGLSPEMAIVAPIAADEEGRPRGFLVTAVNPLRPLDDDYRSFFDLVAKQVSSAVAHGQAYEAERTRAETLAELDRAKTEFFSNVSHEFRTPLTLMLGPLEELLQQAEPGSESAATLDMARRNALRLLKLVNTLLDFARIEIARSEVHLEPVDLAAYTADLASVFRSAIEQAGLRFVVDCPPLADPVLIDRAMWEKVVLNLLSNALKFTLQGEIRIDLRDLDGRIVVRVSDTGTGIASGELPRIFERFYRTRDSGSRTHEGAGIGLALVRELVQIMGGEIQVSSEVGRGTSFAIALPYRDAVEQLSGASASGLSPRETHAAYAAEALAWVDAHPQKSLAAQRTVGDGREGRVLIVDDNADMRAYLSNILREGWEIEAVADGLEALEAIDRARPDLVLTDVMMPRMGGFELLSRIRANREWRDLPVVIVSARAGEESIDGLMQGADDYLVKPFTAHELRARIGANVRLSRLRSELAHSRAQLDLAVERASFLNMAAHELRTPLTVIGGYVDLLLEGVLDPTGPEGRAALEKVGFKTREGVRLVDQMLAAARMESGTIAVNAATADVRDAAAQAVTRAQPLAELESTEVGLVVPEQPVLALVDPALIGLVLDNLIANAIFHGEGPIRVEVEASPPLVRVRDSGPGVAEGARGRIFEPFYEVEGHLRARGGAGLGLAVSRRLAELHGGSLVLESSESGASFVLTLPATETAPAATAV
jgi:signal transduction histidine kinase